MDPALPYDGGMGRLRGTRDELEALLARRNEHPESLQDIDDQIWGRFGETHAVLVLDMCGFSRLTMRYGITHFLGMIQRLHRLVRPLAREMGGQVVKTEADNVFAVFPEVRQAAGGALAIQQQLAEANAFLPQDWDLYASIGVGYGRLLMVGEDDLYGHELNIASKLGEDLAERSEILLTEAAYGQLGPHDLAALGARCEQRTFQVSGMSVTAFKVVR